MKYVSQFDPEVVSIISQETKRQFEVVRLIPSENYASHAVQEAMSCALNNKYSEGYPHNRYYQGQRYIDQMELLTQKRAMELFGAEHANVQPYSGSPANLAVYLGLVGSEGVVVGMDLAAGGHLTHGAKVSSTGKFYTPHQYGVTQDDNLIDYDQIARLAREHKPKMIIAGHSAYPRKIDFDKYREIADEAGAYLLADISHISGFCITGYHANPCPVCDAVVTTTHKLLRGPRGGLILCKNEVAPKIDKAVFPGLQGGPHNTTIASMAVAFKEAGSQEYKEYCGQVIKNAKALGEELKSHGFRLVTGGTDTHLLLVDCTSKGLAGKPLAQALEDAGIVCNYNKIPFDPRPANDPSGVRMGTPAVTSRGMKEADMKILAQFINRVADVMGDQAAVAKIGTEVKEMITQFEAPGLF